MSSSSLLFLLFYSKFGLLAKESVRLVLELGSMVEKSRSASSESGANMPKSNRSF